MKSIRPFLCTSFEWWMRPPSPVSDQLGRKSEKVCICIISRPDKRTICQLWLDSHASETRYLASKKGLIMFPWGSQRVSQVLNLFPSCSHGVLKRFLKSWICFHHLPMGFSRGFPKFWICSYHVVPMGFPKDFPGSQFVPMMVPWGFLYWIEHELV
jgi:hypothetical protein